jgi:succinate-semialdehyde dehydrogenase/glutarate-semialdehyde dehydrogenase
MLVRTLVDAGLPPGVLNLVHGPAGELSEALLSHPDVRVVSFTGSTQVGSEVMTMASRGVARPLLELGGNAAFIVTEDAHLGRAVQGAVAAKFRNSGQSCIAANRFIVHRGIYNAFVREFAARADALVVGDGSVAPYPDLGPCIDSARVRAVENLVADAIDRGARRATKEGRRPPRGSFLEPILVVDATADCAITTEEVFGPAAAIICVDSDEEAVDLANSTSYGLAAYVYTQSAARAWRFAEELEVGVVGLNDALPTTCVAPMGGVKQSGIGREGSRVGLEEFEETKSVSWDTSP